MMVKIDRRQALYFPFVGVNFWITSCLGHFTAILGSLLAVFRRLIYNSKGKAWKNRKMHSNNNPENVCFSCLLSSSNPSSKCFVWLLFWTIPNFARTIFSFCTLPEERIRESRYEGDQPSQDKEAAENVFCQEQVFLLTLVSLSCDYLGKTCCSSNVWVKSR